MTNQKERLFFALELDDNFRVEILNLIQELKRQDFARDINWSIPEKLHVTLHFLGSVDVDKKRIFLPQVETILSQISQFSLTPSHIITLPKRHPRLIAIKLELSKPLAILYNKLKEPLLNSEIVLEDRPYLPHITLGRTKDSKPLLPKQLEMIELKLPKLNVEVVSLFQSNTLMNGSVYTILKRFWLVKQ